MVTQNSERLCQLNCLTSLLLTIRIKSNQIHIREKLVLQFLSQRGIIANWISRLISDSILFIWRKRRIKMTYEQITSYTNNYLKLVWFYFSIFLQNQNGQNCFKLDDQIMPKATDQSRIWIVKHFILQNPAKIFCRLQTYLKIFFGGRTYRFLWHIRGILLYSWQVRSDTAVFSKKNLHRNSKAEPSVICQYVCQSFLFVQPIRS